MAARARLGLALVAILIAGWLAAVEPPLAHACTGENVPPDDDSVRYVVGGWVRALSYEEQHPINALEPIEITYTFEADRSWRGQPPATFTFVDGGSATGDTDSFRWGAMCGAMQSDPTDRYFLLAIPWEAGRFNGFYVYGRGESPDDRDLDWGLSFISDRLGVKPASAGSAGLSNESPSSQRPSATLVVATVALLVVSRTLIRPTRSPVDRYRSAR
jgi:hypothetical protein